MCSAPSNLILAASSTEPRVTLNTSQSYALVEELLGDVSRAPLLYNHTWCAGEFVIWDNRLVLHSATDGEDMVGERLHTRVRLDGNERANADALGVWRAPRGDQTDQHSDERNRKTEL